MVMRQEKMMSRLDRSPSEEVHPTTSSDEFAAAAVVVDARLRLDIG